MYEKWLIQEPKPIPVKDINMVIAKLEVQLEDMRKNPKFAHQVKHEKSKSNANKE